MTAGARQARGIGGNIILTLCAAVFLVMIFPLRGSMTDDTFIHMQYARNLAETGELSFNRGDPTYGATSPLWVAILAAVYRAGGDLASWSRILSQLFGFASVLLVYRLAWALDRRRSTAAAAALVMCCEAWLVRWSTVGMETSMSVFMMAAVMLASLSASRSALRSALFGTLLFAACLVRPETLLLVPIYLFAFAAAGRGARLLPRFLWAAVTAALLAAWFPLIKAHTGTFFPLTAGAKQGSIALSAAIFGRILIPVKILGATLAIPIAAMLAGGAAWLRGRRGILGPSETMAAPGILAAFIWVPALPAVFVLMDFQVLSRYMILVSPAAVALGVTAAARAARLAGAPRPIKRFGLAALVAVAMIQNILFYGLVVVGPTREFSRGLETVITGMGIWLSQNADPEAVVAAPDIGAIGYYSGLRVLDLGGLVTPEINRMRQDTDVEVIISDGLYLDLGADFLMDRSSEPARFAGKVIRGSLFKPVMSGKVGNLGIRKQEQVTYVLYRIVPEEGGR